MDLSSWIGIKQRPTEFRITPDQNHFLRRRAKFLGLDQFPKSTYYHDSSVFGSHGTLTDFADVSTSRVFEYRLRRFVVDYNRLSAPYDYLSLPAISIPAGSDFSTSFWFDADSYTGSNPGWFRSGSTFCIYQGASDNRPWIRLDGADVFRPDTGVGATTGLHHHAFVVKSGSFAQWYYDGVLQQSATHSTSVPAFSVYAVTFQNDASEGIDGRCGDVMFWDRVVTSSEIRQLADPSNVMLSGLLLPPHRSIWPVATAAPAGISASAVCTGANATVAAAATVGVSVSAVAAGINATTSSTTTIGIAASSASVGTNATSASATTVGIAASAIAIGTTGVATAAAATIVSTSVVATGTAGTASGTATVGIAASSASVGTNATILSTTTIAIEASAECVGTNATVAAVLVADASAIHATVECVGSNANVEASATVAVSASAICTGTNATTASAASVAINASAVCAGANAAVVARLGYVAVTTYNPMMFMVC